MSNPCQGNISLFLFIEKKNYLEQHMTKKEKGILTLSRNENVSIVLVDRQKDTWSLREYEFEQENLNNREQAAA